MDSSEDTEEIAEDCQELSLEDLEPCLIREYDEFPRYFQRWIKYWPKKPYNTKKAYERGFVQAKTKRGNPAALHGEWLISCVERHLGNLFWPEQQIDEKRRREEERLISEGIDERSARDESWARWGDDYEYLK